MSEGDEFSCNMHLLIRKMLINSKKKKKKFTNCRKHGMNNLEMTFIYCCLSIYQVIKLSVLLYLKKFENCEI